MDNVSEAQAAICKRFAVAPLSVLPSAMAGVTPLSRTDLQPVNGLRHPVENDASGWFIWAGEVLPHEDDAFETMHLSHLDEVRPEIVPYLALPPGWRFLIAPDYVDVWFDATLLDI